MHYFGHAKLNASFVPTHCLGFQLVVIRLKSQLFFRLVASLCEGIYFHFQIMHFGLKILNSLVLRRNKRIQKGSSGWDGGWLRLQLRLDYGLCLHWPNFSDTGLGWSPWSGKWLDSVFGSLRVNLPRAKHDQIAQKTSTGQRIANSSILDFSARTNPFLASICVEVLSNLNHGETNRQFFWKYCKYYWLPWFDGRFWSLICFGFFWEDCWMQ